MSINRKALLLTAVVELALLTAGCATASKGSNQSIQIGSKPDGAECIFTRDGAPVGKVTTPGSITVTRSRSSINVVCTKEGYDDGRSVMNSLTQTGPVISGLGVISSAIAVGTLVDMASGADTSYQAALMIKLEPIPPEDQAPRPSAPPHQVEPPVPAASAAAAVATVPAAGAAGPYDGEYTGQVDVLQTNLNPYVPHQRIFDVRVVNGVGTGTVKHVLCDEPGEVFFLVEPSGEVRGKANTRNTTGCTDRFAMLQGRVTDGVMHLTLRLIKNPSFDLLRSAGPATAVAAAAPAVSGPFDGSYRAGLEISPGDIRQLWVRVKGSKATGTSRVALCPTPGAISMNVDTLGAISGEADLQTSASCAARKATLSGHAEGKRLVMTASFADGSKTQEFIFNRESRGAGVDD